MLYINNQMTLHFNSFFFVFHCFHIAEIYQYMQRCWMLIVLQFLGLLKILQFWRGVLFFGKLISKKIDGFKLLSLLFIIDILIFVWNISICEVRTYSYLHRIRLQINQNAVSYALYREHWLALFSYVRRYLIMIIINNFYSAGFWSWKSSQQKYTRGTSLPVQVYSASHLYPALTGNQ